MRVCIAALTVLATLAMTQLAQSQQARGRVEVDRSGKGAVLCAHLIMASMYQYGLICRPDDTRKINALVKSLQDYEAFIVRNSALSEQQAQELTHKHMQSVAEPDIPAEMAGCEGMASGLGEIYDHFSAESIRTMTADTLSIERKPLMNPCL